MELQTHVAEKLSAAFLRRKSEEGDGRCVILPSQLCHGGEFGILGGFFELPHNVAQ